MENTLPVAPVTTVWLIRRVYSVHLIEEGADEFIEINTAQGLEFYLGFYKAMSEPVVFRFVGFDKIEDVFAQLRRGLL